MAYYYYRPKITRDEFQKKAREILSQHPEYEPVEVLNLPNRAICSSWWGQSWCENLERYAIWANNRITLGRNYVRNGAVVDLKINGGNISALVIGHLNEPHRVKIKISPISEERQREIAELAAGKIYNLEEIISGTFPEGLKESFFQKGILFPRPDEIDFECSCSDFANMCRHTAAALYGIGVRLDTNPLYFFEMRGINIDDFVSGVVKGKIGKMLDNIGNYSPRILTGVNLTEIFGMEVFGTGSRVTEPIDPMRQRSQQAKQAKRTALKTSEIISEGKPEKVINAVPVFVPSGKLQALRKELLNLKIENIVLQNRLSVMIRCAEKLKAAINQLTLI